MEKTPWRSLFCEIFRSYKLTMNNVNLVLTIDLTIEVNLKLSFMDAGVTILLLK